MVYDSLLFSSKRFTAKGSFYNAKVVENLYEPSYELMIRFLRFHRLMLTFTVHTLVNLHIAVLT